MLDNPAALVNLEATRRPHSEDANVVSQLLVADWFRNGKPAVAPPNGGWKFNGTVHIMPV